LAVTLLLLLLLLVELVEVALLHVLNDAGELLLEASGDVFIAAAAVVGLKAGRPSLFVLLNLGVFGRSGSWCCRLCVVEVFVFVGCFFFPSPPSLYSVASTSTTTTGLYNALDGRRGHDDRRVSEGEANDRFAAARLLLLKALLGLGLVNDFARLQLFGEAVGDVVGLPSMSPGRGLYSEPIHPMLAAGAGAGAASFRRCDGGGEVGGGESL